MLRFNFLLILHRWQTLDAFPIISAKDLEEKKLSVAVTPQKGPVYAFLLEISLELTGQTKQNCWLRKIS
jgi:hypothetical protein